MLERIFTAALASACLTFILITSTLYMIVRGLFGAVGDGGMSFILFISVLTFIGFFPSCYRQAKSKSDFGPMKRVREEMHLDELREGYEVILRPKKQMGKTLIYQHTKRLPWGKGR